ncbi:hypothetical protein F5883DRAFT_542603 [Diaporthe sp. PMI_573]|nr:hypothetical protein F5883DRAFT_542603 [Diaporthaceae sp. PMI_573]
MAHGTLPVFLLARASLTVACMCSVVWRPPHTPPSPGLNSTGAYIPWVVKEEPRRPGARVVRICVCVRANQAQVESACRCQLKPGKPRV